MADICPTDTTRRARDVASRDWWPISAWWAVHGEVPSRPAVVAAPVSAAEVASVLRACSDARVPVTPAGGRSGVVGGAIPVFGGVALDMTALNGIVEVDQTSMAVGVRAGTYGDEFEATLRSDHGLTVGHWPQSVAMSTVGGWVACRGAGQYSTRYGKMEDLVIGVEVALADGRVIRTGPRAPRAAMGPDLTQVFVGSEGTLGVITEARLRARPLPETEVRRAYGWTRFEQGLDCCRRILRRGATPAVLRLYDPPESQRHFETTGRSVLVVVDEGDGLLVDATAAVVDEECAATGAVRLDDELADRWLVQRNEVPSLGELARGGIVADTIEVAADWDRLPAVYQQTVAGLGSLHATIVVSAHQSHAYTDGACLYFTFAGQPGAERGAAEAYYRQAWEAVMSVTMAHGGAISHHHGIGLHRGPYLSQGLGAAFDVLVAIKASLDPAGIMNPGKLGLPSPFGPPPVL